MRVMAVRRERTRREVQILLGGCHHARWKSPWGAESGQEPARVPPAGTCIAHSLFGEKKGWGEWKMMRRNKPSHLPVFSRGKEDVGSVERPPLETCCFCGARGSFAQVWRKRRSEKAEQGVIMMLSSMEHLVGPVAEPSSIP